MKIRLIIVLLFVFPLVYAFPAFAMDVFHDLPVKVAKGSALGKEKLLGVPAYMVGQKYPGIEKDFGQFKSNKRTHRLNKTEEEACRVAFLSALIALQRRAVKLGADGIVDIKSITKYKRLESSVNYRCVASDLMANVVLTGRIVNFAK